MMLKSLRVVEIIHPIFIKCCEYACDKYWVKVFEDLAIGKMPFGVYLSKDMLCFKGKNSDFLIFDNMDNGQYNYNVTYNFFTTVVGVMSPDQRIKKQLEFESNENERNNWCEIRKKTTKDLLIELYAIDMQNKHGLSIIQTRYLISVVCMALFFRSLPATNITIKNNRISDIIGISFKNNKIIFDLELYNDNQDVSSHTNSVKKRMIDNWKKYLEDLTLKYKIDICTKIL